MNMLAYRNLLPIPQDATIACVSGQAPLRFARAQERLLLRVRSSQRKAAIELPASNVALPMNILEAMAAGRIIIIIPENVECSTGKAAEVFGVSRPFLLKLMEDGHVPRRKVGKQRRVRIENAVVYKAAIDSERETCLDQLADDAQE
jgi:excisionase family DNA binding protein